MCGFRLIAALVLGVTLALGLVAPNRPPDCPDYGTLLYEVAYHCLREVVGPFSRLRDGDVKTIEQVLTTDAFFKQFCSGIADLEPCILSSAGDYWGNCSQSNRKKYVDAGREDVLQTLSDKGFFPDADYLCNGTTVSDDVTELYNRVDPADFSHCAAGEDIQKCLQPWIEEASYFGHGDEYAQQDIDILSGWAQSAYNCLLRSKDQCNADSQDLLFLIFNQTIPNVFRETIKLTNGTQSGNIFSSSRRTTVGVFGDPHLKIYNSKSFVTCAAENSREYLDGPRLKMRGKNQVITVNGWASKATFLTEIEIEVLDPNGNKWVGYEASPTTQSALPVTLDNGQAEFNTSDGSIAVVRRRGSIALFIVPLAAVFTISNHTFGSVTFYTLTLRMGDVVYDGSAGLLINGCGFNDRLNRRNPANPTTTRRRRRSVLEDKCRDVCSAAENVGEFMYNETCYFDCMITEDTQVGLVSMTFAERVESIEVDDSEFELVDDPTPSPEPSSSPQPLILSPVLYIYLICVSTFLYI